MDLAAPTAIKKKYGRVVCFIPNAVGRGVKDLGRAGIHTQETHSVVAWRVDLLAESRWFDHSGNLNPSGIDRRLSIELGTMRWLTMFMRP